MPSPRVVVIPFGVPDEGRGLGLGLAALLHTCVHLDGGGVAVAQLHARRKDEPDDKAPSPVEAFVPPAAWKDIAGRGETPPSVSVVVTGAFEPPVDGHGAIQLLAFDAGSGGVRARVEVHLDGIHAGASLVGAFEQLGAHLGGEIGALGSLRELEWEPLESVLRAERCALHDPLRGGPHDHLAAMLHLERAIGDAPAGRYAAERLASIALDAAMGSALGKKFGAAAVRALTRALEDAKVDGPASPVHVALVEALAAVHLRTGDPREAERRLNAVIAAAPKRTRLYALLAQALRAQGQLDGALGAVQTGLAESKGDPLLLAEQGAILVARGNLGGAAAAWREAMASDPVHPAAFTGLASLLLGSGDAATAQSLVDAALAAQEAHPEVLRRAVQLALASENEGIARASRIARLCGRLLEMVPGDAWASLALAKSQRVLGETGLARARLLAIEQAAPGSAPAAEAMAARLAIDDPATEQEVQSVLRAAQSAALGDLADVAARARRVATLHSSWPAWLAAAVAERRLGRSVAAKSALTVALEVAPGAVAANIELAEVLLALGDKKGAIEQAERTKVLEGGSPRVEAVLAKARVPEEVRWYARWRDRLTRVVTRNG